MEDLVEIEETNVRKKAKIESALRTFMPTIGLVAIVVLFSILTNGRIVKARNLRLMLSQVYVTMICATGVWMIMAVGGLDFSQGSILGLSSIVFCVVSYHSIVLGVLAAMLTGALVGAFNGFFHVKLKIASFIVTICTMYLFRGLCEYLTTNHPIPASVDVLALNKTWFKVVVTLVVLAIGWFFVRFTRFGYDIKAIGAGETAAFFSGCDPDLKKFLVFVISGAMTGLASFVNVIKVGSITGTAGTMLETQLLIALVLGGMPISGGAKARFSNIVVGTLTYCVLEKSLPMVFPVSATQQLFKGIIFLIVVTLTIDHKSLKIIK